jgi:peroxiredoxin
VSLVLDVGEKVPDFELPVGRADLHRERVKLSDALAKGPVVISFYPLAFTKTCTQQMCDARDHMGSLSRLSATIFGFSIDTPHSNAHFAKEQGLNFPILSDPNREVVDAIWATEDVIGVKRVAKRGWMLIAPDGTVAEKWVADHAGHWLGNGPIEAALEKLAARA